MSGTGDSPIPPAISGGSEINARIRNPCLARATGRSARSVAIAALPRLVGSCDAERIHRLAGHLVAHLAITAQRAVESTACNVIRDRCSVPTFLCGFTAKRLVDVRTAQRLINRILVNRIQGSL